MTPTPQGIASRILAKTSGGNLTLFAFDAGQGLTVNTSPFEALVMVLEGACTLTIAGTPVRAMPGTVVRMPADVPHAVDALEGDAVAARHAAGFRTAHDSIAWRRPGWKRDGKSRDIPVAIGDTVRVGSRLELRRHVADRGPEPAPHAESQRGTGDSRSAFIRRRVALTPASDWPVAAPACGPSRSCVPPIGGTTAT